MKKFFSMYFRDVRWLSTSALSILVVAAMWWWVMGFWFVLKLSILMGLMDVSMYYFFVYRPLMAAEKYKMVDDKNG